MRWFGEPWNPNCCAPESRVDTPVGELCERCKRPIRKDDQGLRIPCLTTLDIVHKLGTMRELSIHIDCFLESVGVSPDRFVSSPPLVLKKSNLN